MFILTEYLTSFGYSHQSSGLLSEIDDRAQIVRLWEEAHNGKRSPAQGNFILQNIFLWVSPMSSFRLPMYKYLWPRYLIHLDKHSLLQ